MRRLLSIACGAMSVLVFAALPARAQQFDYDPDGYWKMPSPPAKMGEFKGDDPIGLASRQHIPTDCSINWQDEGGKTYCFASAMSSQIFQEERSSILPKAVAFWAEEQTRTLDASKAPKPGATPPASPPR